MSRATLRFHVQSRASGCNGTITHSNHATRESAEREAVRLRDECARLGWNRLVWVQEDHEITGGVL